MRFDTRTWALIPLAAALNVAAGWLVAALRLPLYMDSLGTILVACLAGPVAGAVTGVVGTLVFAVLTSPVTFCYMPVAVMIGVTVGLLTRRGFMGSVFAAVVGGLLVGVLAALISSPITAYLFAGSTGGGTDVVVAAFRAIGMSKLEACFAQGLTVDIIDKVVCLIIVQSVVAALPMQLRASFPQGNVLGKMASLGLPGLQRSKDGHGVRREVVVLSSCGELYHEGQGWLYELSPGSKLGLLFVSLIGALTLPVIVAIPASAVAGGTGAVVFAPRMYLFVWAVLVLLAAALGGVGLELSRATFILAFPVGLSMVVVNGLFGVSDSSITWLNLPWSWAGTVSAASTALRLVVVIEAAGMVLLTTRSEVLLTYLERHGLPPRWAYVFLASLRLVPTMIRRASMVLQAQTARAMPLGGSLWSRLTVVLPMLSPLILGAIAEAEERALALEARGFGACRRRTQWNLPTRSSWDTPVQIVLILITLWMVARLVVPAVGA